MFIAIQNTKAPAPLAALKVSLGVAKVLAVQHAGLKYSAI